MNILYIPYHTQILSKIHTHQELLHKLMEVYLESKCWCCDILRAVAWRWRAKNVWLCPELNAAKRWSTASRWRIKPWNTISRIVEYRGLQNMALEWFPMAWSSCLVAWELTNLIKSYWGNTRKNMITFPSRNHPIKQKHVWELTVVSNRNTYVTTTVPR